MLLFLFLLLILFDIIIIIIIIIIILLIVGEFKNDDREGFGVFRWSSGNVYEG